MKKLLLKNKMEIRAAKKKELERVFRLRKKIFSTCSMKLFRNSVIYDPYYNLNNTRLVLDHQNNILSNLQIHPRPIKYGKDILLCGIIGAVCTPEKFQHHKYADYVLDDAINYMWLNKFDFSILFGSVDFYLRFGWEPLIFERMFFKDFIVPHSHNKYLIKDATKKEKNICFNVYKNNKFSNNGVVLRNERYWKNLPKWQEGWIKDNLFIIVYQSNKIIAYLRGKIIKDRLSVFEFCSLKLDSKDIVKDMLLYLIKEKDIKTVDFTFENNKVTNLFGKFSKKNILNTGDMLIRMINVYSFINKIKSTLRSRIKKTDKKIEDFKLFLITPAGEILIKITDNRLSFDKKKKDCEKYITFNHENLVKLLFGKYDTIKSLAIKGYKYLDRDQRRILEILFPKQEYTFWYTDEL